MEHCSFRILFPIALLHELWMHERIKISYKMIICSGNVCCYSISNFRMPKSEQTFVTVSLWLLKKVSTMWLPQTNNYQLKIYVCGELKACRIVFSKSDNKTNVTCHETAVTAINCPYKLYFAIFFCSLATCLNVPKYYSSTKFSLLACFSTEVRGSCFVIG